MFPLTAIVAVLICGIGEDGEPPVLAKPVEESGWIVPAAGEASEPVWGVKGGISVGLWPTQGPRGLLRVYAPYLGQPPERMVNFIAIEPVVGGRRGYSELERSDSGRRSGKAMWTGAVFESNPKPRAAWAPAKGRTSGQGAAESLSFYVFVERFENGAQPIVKITLRRDRPYEISLAVFAAEGSAPMSACILTATMGNYGRLRDLWLADEIVRSTLLYEKQLLDPYGFFPPRQWTRKHMLNVAGEPIVAATSDEADPAASGGSGLRRPWRYVGKAATHYWKARPEEAECVVRVNARRSYWPDHTGNVGTIPGGVSYENFELEAPFRAGQEFRFGVTAEGPESLAFSSSLRQKVTDGRLQNDLKK